MGILNNRWLHFAFLLLLLAATLTGNLSNARWRQQMRNFTFDYYNILKPRESTQQTVIVDIDEDSLARIGQWPWPRDILADLVTKLDALGAKVILFDMVFAEPDRLSPAVLLPALTNGEDEEIIKEITSKTGPLPDNDAIFGEAIAKAGNVVTGFAFSEQKTYRSPAQKAFFAKGAEDYLFNKTANATENLPVITKGAFGNGSFYVEPDVDGIIRRVPMITAFHKDEKSPPIVYPSLSLEAMRYILGEKVLQIELADKKYLELDPHRFGVEGVKFRKSGFFVPTDTKGRFIVYFAKADPAWYLPAYKILDGTLPAESVRDKVVLIGTSTIGLKDIRSTPLDPLRPGVEVHLNIIDQILQKKFLYRSIEAEGIETLAIALTGLFIILFTPFTGLVAQAFIVLMVLGGGVWAGWNAYISHGQLIDILYPGLAIIILFLVSAVLTYIRTETERRQVRQAFGLYISPDFMKELTKHPDKLRLGGETRELTVMFTDIRGFTSISEIMSPAALIQLMNEFLTPMSDLVMNNRGTIDKYMGDAMMAFWNAPLDDPDHARHACKAALEMNKALQPINENLKKQAEAEGRQPLLLKAGIGINSGPASVGNMGSRQRFAYSAIGDTVNLASRLEGQTKNYGASILIGPQTQKMVPDFAVLEMDLIRVKGKTAPVRIFSLLGDENYAAQDFFRPWKKAHGEMLEAYRALKFGDMERLITECIRLSGGRLSDFYALYAQRLDELRRDPPAEGWDGVYTATSK